MNNLHITKSGGMFLRLVLATSFIILLFISHALSSPPYSGSPCVMPDRTFSTNLGTSYTHYLLGAMIPFEDFDEDGKLDFIANALPPSGKPQTMIVSGLTGNELKAIEGLYRYDSIADLDGDGILEILVTTDTKTIEAQTPRYDHILFSLECPVAYRCLVAPDFSGDALPDILCPMPDDSLTTPSSRSGFIEIHRGLDGEWIGDLSSPEPIFNGYFGDYTISIGDTDGDGMRDILTTERRLWERASAHGKRFHLFSGATQSLIRSFDFPAAQIPLWGSDQLTGLVDLEELNHDGIADFAVFVYRSQTNAQIAFIVSGADGSILGSIGNLDSFLHIPFMIQPIADLDDDGLGELAISFKDSRDLGNLQYWSLAIYSPKNFQQIFPFCTYEASSAFSSFIYPMPDENHDGCDDVIIFTLYVKNKINTLKADIHYLVPRAAISTTLVDFGQNDPLAGPSKGFIVTLKNLIAQPLLYREPAAVIEGPDAADFTLTHSALHTLIGPANDFYGFGTQPFSIQFDPSTLGEKNAALVISTNDPTSPVLKVDLVGNALRLQVPPRAIYISGEDRIFEINPENGERRLLSEFPYQTAQISGYRNMGIINRKEMLVSTAGSCGVPIFCYMIYNELVWVNLISGAHRPHPFKNEFVGTIDHDHRENTTLLQGMKKDRFGKLWIANEQKDRNTTASLGMSCVLHFDDPESAAVVCASSAYEGIGIGLEFYTPNDLDFTSTGALIVSDFVQGIFEVDPLTGNRRLIAPSRKSETGGRNGLPQLYHPLAICVGEGNSIYLIMEGAPGVFELDRFNGELTEVSGLNRGEGPILMSPACLDYDPKDQTLVVYDTATRGVLRIQPESGDRKIISGGNNGDPIGAGPILPSSAHDLVIYTLDAPQIRMFMLY